MELDEQARDRAKNRPENKKDSVHRHLRLPNHPPPLLRLGSDEPIALLRRGPSANVPITCSSRCDTSALRMMRDTSVDMRCTISRGTPAGAIMAAQVLPSRPS